MKRLTIVLLVAALGIVLAQGWMMQPPINPGYMNPGGMMQSPMMGQGMFADSIHTKVAELLGITGDELFAFRQDGKTLAAIIEELGGNQQDITAQLVQERNTQIDQARSSGSISQVQAERMKTRSEAVIAAMLTRTVGMGSGMMTGSMPCPYHATMMPGHRWNR
jgi:hypothetical protein